MKWSRSENKNETHTRESLLEEAANEQPEQKQHVHALLGKKGKMTTDHHHERRETNTKS